MNDLLREIERDCGKFENITTVARVCYDLITVAAPTAVAWLIGDMTDSLLAIDLPAIQASLPPFLLAMALVLVTPLPELWMNLLLTKQGYAHDGFLMEKFLRKPLLDIQRVEAGTVMERLEMDVIYTEWNYTIVHGRPFVLAGYALLLLWVMVFRGYHPLFCLGLVLLALLPVGKSALLGKKKAVLTREKSEYAEKRRSVEQELHPSRDFLWGFGLENFTLDRLRALCKDYVNQSGRRRFAFDATSQVLTFLCDYGVQAAIILWGGILVSLNLLSLGALVGGFLMLPAVTKFCSLAAAYVEELRGREQYYSRLTIFYGETEPQEPNALPPEEIRAEGLGFTYPDREAPALENVSLTLTGDSALQLLGPNGSGKTTLLSILAGLYPAQRGSLTDGEGRPLSRARLRAAFAVQEQSGAIFGRTAAENLFLAPGQEEAAAELLAALGFEKPLDYAVEPEGKNLSPGERKKLLLARALLRPAPFLALDEPLNHLDDQGRDTLSAWLRQREGGLLLISHRPMPGVEAEPLELPARPQA